MDGVAVKGAIILAGTECSILFRNEEEWSGLWGFGGYNVSSLKMFIDESFASFLFSRVKRIDFRDLWDKGIFELNGVIEGLMSVTVEDPPISFSPFSLVDCTMLNHFSFNDFIAIAFPDLAGDLDIQI